MRSRVIEYQGCLFRLENESHAKPGPDFEEITRQTADTQTGMPMRSTPCLGGQLDHLKDGPAVQAKLADPLAETKVRRSSKGGMHNQEGKCEQQPDPDQPPEPTHPLGMAPRFQSFIPEELVAVERLLRKVQAVVPGRLLIPARPFVGAALGARVSMGGYVCPANRTRGGSSRLMGLYWHLQRPRMFLGDATPSSRMSPKNATRASRLHEVGTASRVMVRRLQRTVSGNDWRPISELRSGQNHRSQAHYARLRGPFSRSSRRSAPDDGDAFGSPADRFRCS